MRTLSGRRLAIVVGTLVWVVVCVIVVVTQVSSSGGLGAASASTGESGQVDDPVGADPVGAATAGAGSSSTGLAGTATAGAAASHAGHSIAPAGQGSASAAGGGYQRALASEVVDAAGAPRTGRDPAAQRQVSLAEAAGRQPGPVVQSAGRGIPVTPVDPAQVLGNPKTSGVMSNGCARGYGRSDQCVPARAPGNLPQTCAYLLTLFPDGVPVTATDLLGLDTNKDGWACSVGDVGVPAGSTHEHSPSG